jgi:3-amino-4-hydroxybenzoic acid synthase
VKFGWIDLRSVPTTQRQAVVDAAVHARIDAIVDDGPAVLATLPPTVKKVLIVGRDDDVDTAEGIDIVMHTVEDGAQLDELRLRQHDDGRSTGGLVHVTDDASLKLACSSAITLSYTVVAFRDPTKIPLEIVIAAADKSPGQLICQADSLEEAEIIADVLEKGSEGVLFAPRDANDVFGLAELLSTHTPELTLSTLTVDSIEHSGLGDRVCVDTCTHLDKDEGILVGSYAHGFVLCSSETHPLPYMPTRPFRINAGALHSYVVGMDNRTNYLSELQSGSTVLAVGADGRTRRVAVGRTKLESRPLLTIKATSDEGMHVSLAVQDDWHVRVLGPGGAVLNVTELRPGDQLLGYLATDKRHVGWPVGEFCVEK